MPEGKLGHLCQIRALVRFASANNTVFIPMHRGEGIMEMERGLPKLMNRGKATMQVKRYSPRTEKTYCYRIRYSIRFHGIQHPVNTKAASGKSPINRAPTWGGSISGTDFRHATAPTWACSRPAAINAVVLGFCAVPSWLPAGDSLKEPM